MKYILSVIALLSFSQVVRADSFIADFSCVDNIYTDCSAVPKRVPLRFNRTDGEFHGTAHFDATAWNFTLPANWATGLFAWAGFVDTSSSDTKFITFRIEQVDVARFWLTDLINGGQLCPTEKSCQHGYSYGDVVFRDPPDSVPEPRTIMLLLSGLALVILFRPVRR